MNSLVFGFFTKDIRVSLTEFSLIEVFSEFLTSFSYLFLDFLIDFAEIILYEVICTISFFGILVVDKRVVECVNVSRSLPCLRVHENARIDTDYILMKTSHRLPPISLDVILKFHTHLAVIINGCQSIIDLA